MGVGSPRDHVDIEDDGDGDRNGEDNGENGGDDLDVSDGIRSI